ncbi:hypothetical protein [Phorcysia thermohydrogeniphila]|uniref:Uncharacterized protein n=1 Tax=Phorcysia thermohydrogeniphila TaxID=936138 RepID=A0A4R1GJK9_9BACT|nr:hypothetical protein [Phorcysia thermohydrogeniphila]TCK04452.1 hypothetical protein CLV27_0877 [Phorcysia thermohydrogeniphila]
MIETAISILERANIDYFLIRPVSKGANDIDIYVDFYNLFKLISYLQSHKINIRIITSYKYNTLFLSIGEVVIDVHTPVIAFSHFRDIPIPLIPKKVDYFYFGKKKIPIAPEPYLFFYWFFHYIFDKKSFSKGSSCEIFKERYCRNFRKIIEEKESFSFLTYLFRDKATDVKQILENDLFSVPEVLPKQQIIYLDRIVVRKRVSFREILKLKIRRKIKGVKMIDINSFKWQEEFFQTYP